MKEINVTRYKNLLKNFLREHIPVKYRLMFHQLIKYFWLLKIKKGHKTRFIIYGMGRSGSTLLTSLINSHPNVFCDSEIMSHNTVHRLLFPYIYLSAVSKKIIPPINVYGCGIMSYQLQHQKIKNQNTFLKKMVKKGWKIIHIRRNNIMNVAISIILAQHDNLWEVKNKPIDRAQKEYVSVKEFCKYVKILQESYKLEDRALKGIPHFKVNYESDLEKGNWKPVMDELFSYLNINSCEIKTDFKKKSQGIKNEVENYKEIINIYKKLNIQCP